MSIQPKRLVRPGKLAGSSERARGILFSLLYLKFNRNGLSLGYSERDTSSVKASYFGEIVRKIRKLHQKLFHPICDQTRARNTDFYFYLFLFSYLESDIVDLVFMSFVVAFCLSAI